MPLFPSRSTPLRESEPSVNEGVCHEASGEDLACTSKQSTCLTSWLHLQRIPLRARRHRASS